MNESKGTGTDAPIWGGSSAVPTGAAPPAGRTAAPPRPLERRTARGWAPRAAGWRGRRRRTVGAPAGRRWCPARILQGGGRGRAGAGEWWGPIRRTALLEGGQGPHGGPRATTKRADGTPHVHPPGLRGCRPSVRTHSTIWGHQKLKNANMRRGMCLRARQQTERWGGRCRGQGMRVVQAASRRQVKGREGGLQLLPWLTAAPPTPAPPTPPPPPPHPFPPTRTHRCSWYVARMPPSSAA